MRAICLVYDVPTTCKIPNPSAFLRKCGIRINLSTWVIPEHCMPWDWLRENLSGVSWNTLRFDESEAPKLQGMAKDALRRESARIIKSMTESVEKATADLPVFADIRTEEETDKHSRRVKAALARAKREALAAEECAVAFDLLADVGEAVNAIKHAIKSQMESFLAKTEESPLFGEAVGNA